MGYSKAQTAKYRREELKIIERGGLEKLVESYPNDSKLLQLVHGLDGCKAKSVRAAVLKCTDDEYGRPRPYYKALTRLIDIQVKMCGAKKWLLEKYNTPEKANNALKRLSEKSEYLGYLSTLVECRRFDLYFALRYHGISRLKPKYSPLRKWNKHKILERRLEHFRAGEFLKEDHALEGATSTYWSGESATAVQEWFFMYVDKGGMPSAKEAHEIKGFSEVVKEYGNYDGLKKNWRAFFRKARSGLNELDIVRIRAYREKIPRKFVYNADIKDLKALVDFYKNASSKTRCTILRGVFTKIDPCNIGKVVLACKAGVPYKLIKRAPPSIIEDLTMLYTNHPSYKDRMVFRSMFSPINFREEYSMDGSKLEGLIQALLRPQSLPRDSIHRLRIRAHRLKIPRRFLFGTDIKDLKDMVELFKHIGSNTRIILKGAFANVEPCDAGKVIQTCKAGISYNIVRIIHQS